MTLRLGLLLVWGLMACVGSLIAYHALGLLQELTEVQHQVGLRESFLQLPGLSRFPFLRRTVDESEEILRRGVWLPAVYRYVASLTMMRLMHDNPTWTVLLCLVCLFVSLWFVQSYFVKTYTIDKMVEPTRKEMQRLLDQQRAVKREKELLKKQHQQQQQKPKAPTPPHIDILQEIPKVYAPRFEDMVALNKKMASSLEAAPLLHAHTDLQAMD